ncbi:UDP-3-O-(3-hydroxymyristoyl)glucosamine N-acyltransferase [Altericista sp. CCNU0014]|uniref:UDP-3-O-(3-hydroxymyristoyl)glucosamine N-acyltransferase n=1 Tax=Altericista sp. CCNU0014 TaxID=3082949 RepID=UPI00384F5BE4
MAHPGNAGVVIIGSTDFKGLVRQLGLAEGQTSLARNPHLNPTVTGVAAIDRAQEGAVSFIESAALGHWVTTTQASAVILPPQSEELCRIADQRGIAWMVLERPRLGFARVLALFYRPWQPEAVIHPTAVIDPTATLGAGVAIAARVTIQAGCAIGEGVCIHPNVVIYPDARIGDRTVLHANCTIHERAVIGQDCVIHSGAVIGAEGFGFVPTETGWFKMQQSGRAVLEDGVEVGCNSAIDRPSVGETRVGKGTKIDNLVQVAHGCQIGQHCVLVSQVGLAGAVHLGDRVTIAGQSGVVEKVKIGAGSIVTAKTAVFKDVAEGQTVSGIPAMPNKLWLRTTVLLRRLPELFRKSAPPQ